MAAMETVEALVDAEVVSRASLALKRQGMDISEAMTLMLARIARDGGLVWEPGEDAEYDAWLCAKVQEALDDPRPSIPHEEVRKRMASRREAASARLAS
jgi:DNA-damage-inducible protein J